MNILSLKGKLRKPSQSWELGTKFSDRILAQHEVGHRFNPHHLGTRRRMRTVDKEIGVGKRILGKEAGKCSLVRQGHWKVAMALAIVMPRFYTNQTSDKCVGALTGPTLDATLPFPTVVFLSLCPQSPSEVHRMSVVPSAPSPVETSAGACLSSFTAMVWTTAGTELMRTTAVSEVLSPRQQGLAALTRPRLEISARVGKPVMICLRIYSVWFCLFVVLK